MLNLKGLFHEKLEKLKKIKIYRLIREFQYEIDDLNNTVNILY